MVILGARTAVVALLVGSLFEAPASRAPTQKANDVSTEAILYRKVRVPDSFRSPVGPGQDERLCGGDVRIGDLDNDGEMDLLVFKSIGGMKPSFIGAFDMAGRVLWSLGDRHRTVKDADSDGQLTTQPPLRPGPVAVADLDDDGKTEVIAVLLDPQVKRTSRWRMDGVSLVLIDGKTGKIKHQAAPDPLRQADGFIDGKLMKPNYVHQRLLIANLRGTSTPRDIILKVGRTIFAFDDRFKLLWSYRSKWNRYPKHAAYIPSVGDVDRDGRDEVNGGHFVLDHDGKPMWEAYMGDNMDSVLIQPWDDGRVRAILSAYGQVVDERGQVLLRLGPEEVPHGQEIRCGHVRSDSTGPELIVRYNGHTPHLKAVSRAGKVLQAFDIPRSPNETGIELVYWNGPDQPACVYAPAILLDGYGRTVATLPGLPPPSGGNQGWYHCFPADVCGDTREEVVLYDPYSSAVYIYTPPPLNESAYHRYQHTPRQYNARLMD